MSDFLRSPYEKNGSFRVTSPLGYRVNPISGTGVSAHYGLDLVGMDTTRVAAVRTGRVVRSRIVTDHANSTWEWGNYVAVTDEAGYTLYYCHLEKRLVQEGDIVQAGDVLGVEGATGQVTGRHLHLELRCGSRRCSPEATDTDDCSAARLLGIPNETGVYSPAASASPQETPEGGFDNAPSDWSAEALSWAVSQGMLLGDGTGNYRLREACTREQMLVFLYRLWRLTGGTP